MRTKTGYCLIALSVPYVILGILLNWDSVAMGAVAFIVSGGVLVARGDRRRRADFVEPHIPKAPRTPTDLAPTDEPAISPTDPPPDVGPDDDWKEGKVMLPPPPEKPVTLPKLSLVHSDGRRVDVRDFRRRVASK